MVESHVAEQMENLFEYNGLSNKLHAKRILLSALLGYTCKLLFSGYFCCEVQCSDFSTGWGTEQ